MAASALQAAAIAAVLFLLPSLFAAVAAQSKAKAFCISQFAIASQACSILPPSPPDEHDDDDDDDDDHHDDDHGGGDDDDDDDDDGGDGGDDGDDHDGGDHHRVRRHHHRDRGRRGQAAVVDFSALVASNGSTQIAPAVAGNDTAGHHGNRTARGGGGRGRRHGRGRRGRLRGDDDDDDHGGGDDDDHHDDDDDHDDDDHDEHHDEELRAYRDCCRWLQEVSKDCVCDALMRLPPFLVKPQHTYVVRVGRTCKITYRCGGV